MNGKIFMVCWNRVEIKSSKPFRKLTSKQIDDAIKAEKEKRGDWSPLTTVEFPDMQTAAAWYNGVVEKLHFQLGHGAMYSICIEEAWIEMLTIDEDGEIIDSTMLAYDRARLCL